ncbi:FtsX-like permease family protein [Tepidibacter hydrothermalis]|uniref:ABC transporter permease n=1 Tax=Tepidibacter hydrothermalis TaxID=3036126 RepID=A0ABY8E6W4_9FIRM|nr:ABC transporter permease [Tepidibacter hydrothermalis]WFD08648.1 ABC transporter permease [Tepidibacter hydrothermalis]
MNFWQFALNNVKRNFKTYFAYYLSSAISVMIFFTFAIYIFHPSILYPNRNSLSWAMDYAEMVIFIFSIMFIFYSVNTFLKIRRKEFGVLTIIGMSKRQFHFLIFLENIIIGFLSIITGIIVGLVFTKLLLLLSEKIIGMSFLPFYFPTKAIMYTVIMYFLLFFIISLLTPFLLRIKNINTLIKERNRVDIEIKYSKALSIVSISLMFSGYFMAAFRELEYINNFLYILSETVAVQIIFIFVIIAIGTFFFFTQFSIFIIEKLKNKRRFYMKKINILWISDLEYRIRYNARVLFLVTMILTITFISITSFYVMNTIVKDEIIKKCSISFVYLSLSGNNKEQKHIKEIEDSLKKDGFEFKKYTSTISKQITDDKQEIYIIKLSEYNEIAPVFNMKKVSLKENEIYLVPYSYDYDVKRDEFLNSKTLSLNNGNIILNNVGMTNGNILPAHLFFKTIIVNDYIFETIKNTGEINTYYIYKVSDWEKTGYIGHQLSEKFNRQSGDPFYFYSTSQGLEFEIEFWKILLYLSLFTGVMFLSVAGSFLYLRLYITLNQEKRKYQDISKIGLTLEEMKKASTIQIGIIFFIPYILACVHTYFFIKTLEIVFSKSFTLHLFIVLFAFFVVQFIYFLIIRSKYMRDLSRTIL